MDGAEALALASHATRPASPHIMSKSKSGCWSSLFDPRILIPSDFFHLRRDAVPKAPISVLLCWSFLVYVVFAVVFVGAYFKNRGRVTTTTGVDVTAIPPPWPIPDNVECKPLGFLTKQSINKKEPGILGTGLGSDPAWINILGDKDMQLDYDTCLFFIPPDLGGDIGDEIYRLLKEAKKYGLSKGVSMFGVKYSSLQVDVDAKELLWRVALGDVGSGNGSVVWHCSSRVVVDEFGSWGPWNPLPTDVCETKWQEEQNVLVAPTSDYALLSTADLAVANYFDSPCPSAPIPEARKVYTYLCFEPNSLPEAVYPNSCPEKRIWPFKNTWPLWPSDSMECAECQAYLRASISFSNVCDVLAKKESPWVCTTEISTSPTIMESLSVAYSAVGILATVFIPAVAFLSRITATERPPAASPRGKAEVFAAVDFVDSPLPAAGGDKKHLVAASKFRTGARGGGGGGGGGGDDGL